MAARDVTAGSRAVAPYGSWPSPFAIESLVAGRIALGDCRFDGDPDRVVWIEGRPEEGGRQVLVRWAAGEGARDASPPGMNVRSRVHEYGGAPALVRGDLVVVSDFATGRLHLVEPDGTSRPVTPEGPFRYADLELDERRRRLFAVREDHGGPGEAVNTLVTVDLATGDVRVVAEGSDFVASPRLSPDGGRLAYRRWDHPNLPWDGTELWLARVTDDGLADHERVAGGDGTWIAQPVWAPDGSLFVVAEPEGWMNLHRLAGGPDGWRLERFGERLEIEFAPPDWVFGIRSYAPLDGGGLLAIGRGRGADRLYRFDAHGRAEVVELPWTELASLDVAGPFAILLAAGPLDPPAVVRIDLRDGTHEVLRRSMTLDVDPASVSVPESIAFPTAGGATAYGLYYPPTNPDVVAPEGERPPLVVTSHGGPTSAAYGGFSLATQLFTSRGIAVLDVDYRGSTGYGRAYRKALEGVWGIADVDDCIAGARYLAERGDVDPARTAIRGGSASGYTTLAALAFRDAFAAGISYFGLGDLMAFARETHKFEARYLDRLVGPLPEAAATYRERSPALHMDRCTCPVLVLQGLDDRIVPPSEAERIVDSLWERRIPHAYLPFEGEGHGFRGATAIIRAAEAELSFLGQVFGFTPADDIEPVALQP